MGSFQPSAFWKKREIPLTNAVSLRQGNVSDRNTHILPTNYTVRFCTTSTLGCNTECLTCRLSYAWINFGPYVDQTWSTPNLSIPHLSNDWRPLAEAGVSFFAIALCIKNIPLTTQLSKCFLAVSKKGFKTPNIHQAKLPPYNKVQYNNKFLSIAFSLPFAFLVGGVRVWWNP